MHYHIIVFALQRQRQRQQDSKNTELQIIETSTSAAWIKRTEQENRTMSESSTKKHHRVSYGQEPLEYLDKNKETLCFDIHNFADLSHERGDYIQTKTMKVFGHLWKLTVYPGGSNKSNTDVEHVSIFLWYGGENTETNPVNVNFRLWTNAMSGKFYKHSFTASTKEPKCSSWGVNDFKNREDLIREDLDENGTLTIKVDIIMGKCNVWFPKITPLSKDDIGPRLYSSLERDDTADVTFRVGSPMVEWKAHRIVLSVRAPALYEMVIFATPMDEEGIVFRNINPITFGKILEYIYTNNLPKVKNYKNEHDGIRVIVNNDEDNNNNDDDDSSDDDNDNDDDDDDDDDRINATNDGNNDRNISSNNSNSHAADEEESVAKSILIVANQFGCTGLKLYMESCIVEYLLVPSNAARLLLFADSYACALLKEACMNMCVDDRESVMDSNPNDWNQLKESNNLLEELFTYATSYVGRGICKQYSSVVANGDGTVHDADTFDVTSVRERLEKHNLDIDGSAEMLLQRWKEHLLAL